jgi:hypothetical protein
MPERRGEDRSEGGVKESAWAAKLCGRAWRSSERRAGVEKV